MTAQEAEFPPDLSDPKTEKMEFPNEIPDHKKDTGEVEEKLSPEEEKRMKEIRANLGYLKGPWMHVILFATIPPTLFTLFLWFMGLGFWLSFGITINVWSFFYCKYLSGHFWISADPDEIILVQDVFVKGVEVGSEKELTDPLFLPPDIRAIGGSRFNPKKLWEKVLGEPIDTTKGEIEEKTINSVEDNKNGFWTVTWSAPLTALSGRYAARTPFVDKKLAMEFAKAKFTSAIRKGFRNEDGNDINKDKARFIRKNLEPLFGGSEEISPEEIEFALTFGTPFIVNMEQEGKTKESSELLRKAGAIAGAVETISGKDTKLSTDQAGLLLALSLNPSAEIINVAGLSAFGGEGKQGKKGSRRKGGN